MIPLLSAKTLVVSIAAGKSLATLRKLLGRDVRLVRVMPNLALRAREAEREGSEVHHEQHEQDNKRDVEIHRYPEHVANSELARKHVRYSTIF